MGKQTAGGETLEQKIANTPLEIVKSGPEFAKKVFNKCREECGLKPVDFTK